MTVSVERISLPAEYVIKLGYEEANQLYLILEEAVMHPLSIPPGAGIKQLKLELGKVY